MIHRIVQFALRQRALILLLVAIVVVAGVISFERMPVDAYPDLSPPMVEVITQWPGHAAEEIERLCIAIRASGGEAPAGLLAKADRIVRQHRFRITLRQRLLLSAKVAAGIDVVVLLGVAVWQLARAQQLKSCTASLEQAIRVENLPAFDQTMAGLSHGLGRLFGSSLAKTPAIEALRARRAELAARMQNRNSAYQTAVAALQQIQANRFDAPAAQVLALRKQYLNPGLKAEVDVMSWGADGQTGGEGVNADIGSWQ